MAERKRRAPQVRNHLAAIKSKVARKGATSEEIVSILSRNHPNAIRAETADILHIGLIKLANDACSLRSGPATSTQLEMFAEYDLNRTVLLRTVNAKGRVEKVHKAVDALTKGETRQHIAEHTKHRPPRSKDITELARLLDDLDKYGEEDWTLNRCWKVAHG